MKNARSGKPKTGVIYVTTSLRQPGCPPCGPVALRPRISPGLPLSEIDDHPIVMSGVNFPSGQAIFADRIVSRLKQNPCQNLNIQKSRMVGSELQ